MTEIETPTSETPKGERIAKRMARAGVCSRRDAERLIRNVRVTVNGKKMTTPALNVTDRDHIKVDGKQIIIKINGKQTVDYTEPDDLDRPKRQLSEGTFAIQAHDPKSHVEFKDLMVKMLP